jgi:membrane complex biogenesis BtpA family protein
MARKRRSKSRLLVGVIHLGPLPGSPGWREPLEKIVQSAVAEGETLLGAGFDGLLVENYGDAPFHPDQVPPITVASMMRAALALRGLGEFPLGVNVLRNDVSAALAIAVAAGADFIRVNIHAGAFATDQGLIQGRAHDTLRLRRDLDAEKVEIWADVLCKHARPVGETSLEDAARDLVERACADKLILTGSRTGEPADPEDLGRLRRLRLRKDIIVGSGLMEQNLHLVSEAQGAIVASALRRGGRAGEPLDPKRVRSFIRAWKSLD